MTRLRDEAVLLEPATKTDPYTEETRPDWSKDPLSATPAEFKAQPVNSDEQTLTADTIVTRFKAWLPARFDGIVTSDFRVRWDGRDYDIDGDLERWKQGQTVRYLTCFLKHWEG